MFSISHTFNILDTVVLVDFQAMEALGMAVLVVGLVSMDAPLYLKMMTRTTTIITMLITITMTKTL